MDNVVQLNRQRTPEEELLEAARLGIEVESSRFVAFMLQKASEESDEALEELATVYWWRTRRIRYLQYKVWRAYKLAEWVNEAVQYGTKAQALARQLEVRE